MFESLLNFVLYWVSEIINVFLNIVPIGWALNLINLFSPSHLLENTSWIAIILIWLMLTVIIWWLIIQKIELMFSNDNIVWLFSDKEEKSKEKWIKGYWVILLMFQWLIWVIRTKEFFEKFLAWRNLNAIIFSLLFILFLFAFSFNWIRTADDLISMWIDKELQNSNISSEWVVEVRKITSDDIWKQQEQSLMHQFKNDVTTVLQWSVAALDELRKWEKIETPVSITINKPKKEEEKEKKPVELEDLLTQKRIAQKFFLWITINWDKPVSSDTTYYLAWLPLEPISYSKVLNFIYYTVLLLVIIAFWLIVIAISPILDFFTIIFTKRQYDYVDYIWMFLRTLIAVLVFIWLFNVYTV